MLTLLRHGESEWNRQRRFTGWSDVDLTAAGAADAERAGRLLARSAPPVDRCFTSLLRRAARTAEIALSAAGASEVPIERSWRLNERHYGRLEGLGIWPAVRRYGPLTVWRCRRRFEAVPPPLRDGDPRLPRLEARDGDLPAAGPPRGESVADTQARLLPYWQQRIVPELVAGRHVLVVSHRHTLRALRYLLESRLECRLSRFAADGSRPIVMELDARDLARLDDPQLAGEVPA